MTAKVATRETIEAYKQIGMTFDAEDRLGLGAA